MKLKLSKLPTIYSRGMTVVESVVSIAVFSLLVGSAFQIYINTNILAQRSDHKAVALSLAEEGIEAVRSIRDQNFSNLTSGTKGIALSGNTWQFSGTSDYTNMYMRTLVLSSVDSDTWLVTSSVSWPERRATTTVSVATNLTNWHKQTTMASGLSVDTTGANLSLLSVNTLLTGINLISDGSYATTTITRIQATWAGVLSTRRLTAVQSPNGTSVWTGNASSGTNVTLTTPITVTSGATKSIQFYYNATMLGGTFTYVFTFSDGSTKTVVITNPPTGL